MKPSRSKKRRRLVQSYVLPQGPDLPARFESLNDDTLTTVLEFVGDKSYRSFGGVNKHCKEVYITSGMTKETFLYGYAPLSVIQDRYNRTSSRARDALSKGIVCFNRKDVLEWVLQEEKKTCLLISLCRIAAKEGRIDLLNEFLNNIDDEDDIRFIFGGVDEYAAKNGKLNVLKWFETKALTTNNYWCARKAAKHGHIHIIQWLRDERGLELGGYLYAEAIQGDQLHVMKWLREQEVNWNECTFRKAAWVCNGSSKILQCGGNLDILQWLHDEGCPWPQDYLAHEGDLKPETIDWCRSNGYGNRLYGD